MQQLNVRAADEGVDIWLENLSDQAPWHPFHTIFSNVDDYTYVLEANPDVYFTVDVGHDHISSHSSLEIFDRFHDRIVAIDGNDNNGEVDTHSRRGDGTVQFAKLVAVLHATQWRGSVTLETRGTPVSDGVAYLAELWSACAG